MEDNKPAIKYREGQLVLFESSIRAIPFNVIMASILSLSLFYNKLPKSIVISWLSAIIIISILRIIYCKLVLKHNLLKKASDLHLKIFLALTGINGLIWAEIYFASLPHTDKLQLYLILLVCGGMAAGSTASLGVYLPAFYMYILTIFFPIIVYNYSFLDVNDVIFATMFVLFLVAITIIARSHQKLFAHTFFLTEQNKELKEKFEVLSITDALTGLFNRRHFNKVLGDEYNRAKRNQHSFALVSIDIDNFKLVNDNLGHPFGDRLVVYLADYLRHYLKRANDIIFRTGGDEFAVLLLNINEANVKSVCEKIHDQFLKEPGFKYPNQDNIHKTVLENVSLSLGATFIPYESTATIEQIIALADLALYKSKQEGKNQINYNTCL